MTNTASELEIIRTFWPIVYAISTAALAFVVWLIRLEGKQKSNHEKIVQVEKMQETEGHRMAKAIETMSDTQSKMADSLSDMRATLSGIVGYDGGKKRRRRGGENETKRYNTGGNRRRKSGLEKTAWPGTGQPVCKQRPE